MLFDSRKNLGKNSLQMHRFAQTASVVARSQPQTQCLESSASTVRRPSFPAPRAVLSGAHSRMVFPTERQGKQEKNGLTQEPGPHTPASPKQSEEEAIKVWAQLPRGKFVGLGFALGKGAARPAGLGRRCHPRSGLPRTERSVGCFSNSCRPLACLRGKPRV